MTAPAFTVFPPEIKTRGGYTFTLLLWFRTDDGLIKTAKYEANHPSWSVTTGGHIWAYLDGSLSRGAHPQRKRSDGSVIGLVGVMDGAREALRRALRKANR